VSPSNEKQTETDKASASSISLPFRASNATSMVVHTPASNSLIIPTEQTEAHDVASSTGVCKIEQEEEANLIECPRAPQSEMLQRHLVFATPQPVCRLSQPYLSCSHPCLILLPAESFVSQSQFSRLTHLG